MAAAPNGHVYAAEASDGVRRSSDAGHEQWTPTFDEQQTTAEARSR